MTSKMNGNNSQPRVLVVDPDGTAARECREDLESWGYEVVISQGHLQALTILDDFCVDMVLVRMEPSDIDGTEFCRLVRRRQREYGRQQVFLLLLGREEHRSTITEQSLDADDFLIEPFLKSELRWRLAAGLRSVKLQRRLNQFLQTDPETGLLTREGLDLFLLEEVNRTSRRRGLLTLLLIHIRDLEGAAIDFGRNWINWLQEEVAGSIRKSLRNYDRLARIEEGVLCLVLSETGVEGARTVAKRLRKLSQVLANQNPALAEISFSVQVTSLTLRLQTDFTGVRKGVERLWTWVDSNLQGDADSFEEGVLSSEGIELNS